VEPTSKTVDELRKLEPSRRRRHHNQNLI
jgi:hypothetical protein